MRSVDEECALPGCAAWDDVMYLALSGETDAATVLRWRYRATSAPATEILYNHRTTLATPYMNHNEASRNLGA